LLRLGALLNKSLEKIKTIAFDLDGTIYFGEKLADGVIELLDFLRQKEVRIFYFTNNSSKTRKQIYEKLVNLGLELDFQDVYNSAYAAAVYAKSRNFKNIFCCGTPNLKDQFTQEGLKSFNRNKVADAIFIGLDVSFNYQKLAEVLAIIKKSECPIIACNIDKNYPVENDVIMPGCGSIVSSIENCSERKIDFTVGKPNSYMLELLMKDHGVIKDEILVVGDSYDSDITMAKNFGCASVLIAQDKRHDVLVIKSIKHLISLLNFL
jgi:HAD superfamily hydrolase (TIGR01450 family)